MHVKDFIAFGKGLSFSIPEAAKTGGRVLELVSGLVMAALGLMLVFAPRWLSWG